jgi:hypothetical protein
MLMQITIGRSVDKMTKFRNIKECVINDLIYYPEEAILGQITGKTDFSISIIWFDVQICNDKTNTYQTIHIEDLDDAWDKVFIINADNKEKDILALTLIYS